MGTRNLTKIIYHGETKVCQYGQWDGHPTTAMAEIVGFLKNQEKVDALLSVLPKVLLCTERSQYESSTLPDERYGQIHQILNDYRIVNEEGFTIKTYLDLTFDERIDHVATSASISREDALRFLLETRNTGYQIMDVLVTFAARQAESIPVISCGELWDEWDIEAKYTIDFDAGLLTAWWHGVERAYPLDQLPDMQEIESLEKEGFEK